MERPEEFHLKSGNMHSIRWIEYLEARVKELEKQKDELLVRVLSQCRGDCTAAAKRN